MAGAQYRFFRLEEHDMGLLDRLRGMGVQRPAQSGAMTDEQAIERYRYMLRTAPPETIEQAHAEAFARLTPDQRRKVLRDLGDGSPDAVADDPAALARAATRAEIRQPGTIERAFGTMAAPAAGAPGMGSLFAGSLLSSMAGAVLGSMIAQHFFANDTHAASLFGGDAARLPDPGTSYDHAFPFTNASDDVDAGSSDSFDSGDSFDTGGIDGGGDSFDV
jgi:hypothetical protein